MQFCICVFLFNKHPSYFSWYYSFWKFFKTAIYHRHTLQLSLLLEIRKMNNIFLNALFINFCIFLKVQVSGGRKALNINTVIWYAFWSKFANFNYFEKILLLCQKIPNFERFQECYCFSGIIRQILCNLVANIFELRKWPISNIADYQLANIG